MTYFGDSPLPLVVKHSPLEAGFLFQALFQVIETEYKFYFPTPDGNRFIF
jgi:hypothetical protein